MSRRRRAAAAAILRQLLRRLEWTVIRRLDGLLQGDYRTLFRGFGLDLADLREYQHHDDVRHIDWNVTARLQTPYVREFHEDRELTAWFLLDLSARRSISARTTHASARSSADSSRCSRACSRATATASARCSTATDVDTVIPARGGRRHVLRPAARACCAAGRRRARPSAPTCGDLLQPAQRS